MNLLYVLVLTLASTQGDRSVTPEPRLSLATDPKIERQEVELPPQDPLERTLKLEDGPEDPPWIDFEWMELHLRAGVAVFTDDYRIDPTPFVSLQLRAPVPLFSPSSNAGGDYIGMFIQADVVPGVDRDLNPPSPNSSGTLVFATAGLDYTFLRNQSLYLTLQGGVNYGWYGGIDDLKTGTGAMAGISLGIYLGSGLTFTATPQIILADGDHRIYQGSLGLLIEF